MTTASERGFTIIELMLFLGITGALFAALMFGVNANITQQRYRESVVNYSTLLQDQYSEVSNTRNERDGNWKCEGGIVSQQPTGGDARGTTSCVLLGRAVQISANGTTIKTSPVIGLEPARQDSTSDITTLLAYHPNITSYGEETTSIDWGSSLATTNHEPSTASFLILRSPASGLLRVFASSSPLPADISSIIAAGTASTKLTNCVQGDSGSLPIQSVSIDPRIAGPDGVILNEVDPACA